MYASSSCYNDDTMKGLNSPDTSDSSRTVTRQSLYLSTNVEYVSGNGSTESPFVIQ